MVGVVKAVLGPTNTGKTHYAVERMLAYSSGVMGFPLRLLAREVYDKVVRAKGERQVALLTGEERIVPEGARYFLCTAEAMPRHAAVDFVAIDEVQMAADPQRGHVFTEHMLHTRGRNETLLLGAETMRSLILRLVPEVEILTRPRFSKLTHIKPAKLHRLPRRSAVVGFSAAEVYGMAELMRRQKGGAAIVMGALSPRTRNAQVEMYQSGEVDYLIATDAIGMGLNMDIGHVAFGSLQKFDGRLFRDLRASEAAQIAGRAGRFKKDGTFSTLGGGVEAMDPMMVAQIEDHQFQPVKHIFWRNHRLDFKSISRLIRSLEMPATTEGLHRSRESVDLLALKKLSEDPDIQNCTTTPAVVQQLWDVCQIPDFKKLSIDEHINLLKRIFMDLMGKGGVISHDWFTRQVKRLDNTHGDIDTLAARIASIRIWTYVSHRKGWLEDAAHWAHVTRSVEDKLSDALHERLTQRFVDRRTAVLMRSLRQKGELSVSIDENTNQVSVEGHEIGELNGFSFRVEAGAARDDQKTLKAAAETALRAELTRRAKLFANVGFKTLEFDFSEGLAFPKVVWEGAPVATVHHSGALFAPRVKLVSNTLLEGENAELVQSKIQEWLDTRITEKLDPIVRLAQELNGEAEAPEGAAPLTGLARGIAYRLLENYGAMARTEIDNDLRQIDQEARKGLRRFGIRIGASSLYIPILLKPHATELRLMMWAMEKEISALPGIPTPGMVWTETEETAPDAFYELAGFRVAGKKAVRMDMLERLADTVRPLGQEQGWFEVTPEIMGLVGLSGEDFANVMKAAGYTHEVRMVKPDPVAAAPASEEEGAEADAKPAEGSENENADTAPAQTEAPEPVAGDVSDSQPAAATNAEAPDQACEAVEAVAVGDEADTLEQADDEASAEEELVERYFFKWISKRRAPQKSGKPNQKFAGKGKGGKPRGGKGGPNKQGRQNQNFKPKKEKVADPDSPFAALAGLKGALSNKK
jgi:ATP-dependent RNA helicase SUPV3L1/SUV3